MKRFKLKENLKKNRKRKRGRRNKRLIAKEILKRNQLAKIKGITK